MKTVKILILFTFVTLLALTNVYCKPTLSCDDIEVPIGCSDYVHTTVGEIEATGHTKFWMYYVYLDVSGNYLSNKYYASIAY